MSLSTSKFPSIWKQANILPLHKTGSRADIKNYRPITIINNFAKIFESLIYNYMYNETRNYLTPLQHGFIKARSTVTNLFIITNEISMNFDKMIQTDVIYTDLAKAFDRVDHSILLAKIHALGFGDDFVKFLRTYIFGRGCRVLHRGSHSAEFTPSSGVPQGSNLGPLLFNIFINDIVDILDVDALLYADDLKLYRGIRSIEDCLKLQSNLDELASWCLANKLNLNISKCHVVSFSLRSVVFKFDYEIDSQVLLRQTSIRDLGVLFDDKLLFTEHINNIVSASFRLCGYVIRNSHEFSADTLLKMFTTLILPKLEYGAIIWNPHAASLIKLVEGVQRHFLKFAYFRLLNVYPPIDIRNRTLRATFNVAPLFERRNSLTNNFMIGILENRYDCPTILGLLFFLVPRFSSRSSRTFYLPVPRTETRKNSPLYRMCELYERNLSERY